MKPDEREAYLEQRLEALLGGRAELPPPWAEYPEWPQGSMFWRSAGEEYLELWQRWLTRLPPARAPRVEYFRHHPPATARWSGSLVRALDPPPPPTDRGARRGAGTRARGRGPLEEALGLGLIAPDAGYLAWTRRWQRTDGPHEAEASDPSVRRGAPPPWERSAGPGAAFRTATRALNFWVRWVHDADAADHLAAPQEWVRLVDALRTRRLPSFLGFRVFDRWEQHALVLAAEGTLPPPWERGEPASSLHRRPTDEPSYADAWAQWVSYAFDDQESWQRYLARHRPPPAEWEKIVARRFSFPAATLRGR